MKAYALIVFEIALLFGALFFTLTALPSTNDARISFLPAGAFSAALFAGSRLLRWRHHGYFLALGETAAFALFAWVSNEIANALYGL